MKGHEKVDQKIITFLVYHFVSGHLVLLLSQVELHKTTFGDVSGGASDNSDNDFMVVENPAPQVWSLKQ